MKKFLIFLLALILLINPVYAYEVEYVHQDHLGNNIAITNEQGEVIWKADYEPFGNSFNELNENNNYKYNSKELDVSTGLLYYGARYYDSKIGRFTTPDPVSGSIINPQSLNRYVYTLNNPLKYVDPSGRKMKLSSMEYRDDVLNWMNEVTEGHYFWINEEGNFQYVKGFKGSKEQRKIYNLFVDAIKNKNIAELSIGENLESQVGPLETADSISLVRVSLKYGDDWYPLGEGGNFIYFNPQVVLVHELAHTRGKMLYGEENREKFGESIAVKNENYARKVLGLGKRIFYAHGSSSFDVNWDSETTKVHEYSYTLPEHFDRTSPILRMLGLGLGSYKERYEVDPSGEVTLSKYWIKYNKKDEYQGIEYVR